MDDGESIVVTEYILTNYSVATSGSTSTLTATTQNVGSYGAQLPTLATIDVFGVPSAPTAAQLNGAPLTTFAFNSTSLTVHFDQLTVDMGSSWTLNWTL